MLIVNWLRENKTKVELVLVVLLAAAALLHYYATIEGSEQAVVLFAFALAGFYFLSSFFVPDEELPLLFATVGIKVINISSAVSLVGIVFVLTGAEGALDMLMVGLLSLIIAGLLILYFLVTLGASKLLPYLVRVICLGGITGYMFFSVYKAEPV